MDSRIDTTISEQALNIACAFQFVDDEAHGGTAVFQGTIRNLNFGRPVIGISYDVFEPLAIKSFNDLSLQAMLNWKQQLKIYIAHAKGRLSVGAISVLIAVSSPHRDEAFQACRFLIEGIKHNSPIWKQEHYADGDSEWVKGHALCTGGQHD